jgi:hypothetical protein
MKRTTVELPEDLMVAAKKRAAGLRRPLRELIEAGLRSQLSGQPARGQRERNPIRWVTVAGGLPAGLNVASRPSIYRKLRRAR